MLTTTNYIDNSWKIHKMLTTKILLFVLVLCLQYKTTFHSSWLSSAFYFYFIWLTPLMIFSLKILCVINVHHTMGCVALDHNDYWLSETGSNWRPGQLAWLRPTQRWKWAEVRFLLFIISCPCVFIYYRRSPQEWNHDARHFFLHKMQFLVDAFLWWLVKFTLCS